MRTARVTELDDRLLVKTPYSPEYIYDFQTQVPKDDREWDREDRVWVISDKAQKDSVVELLRSHFDKVVIHQGEPAVKQGHRLNSDGRFFTEALTAEQVEAHRQEILTLRAQGLKNKEIAETLGISVATVTARLKRAKDMDANGGKVPENALERFVRLQQEEWDRQAFEEWAKDQPEGVAQEDYERDREEKFNAMLAEGKDKFDQRARDLVEAYARGASEAELAERFNMRPDMVAVRVERARARLRGDKPEPEETFSFGFE